MEFNDWIFTTTRPGDSKVEVTFAEHFNTLSFGQKAEYVVRESFQNSGDAAINSALVPVRIRVFLSGANRALSPNVAKKYFGGLEQHLAACKELDVNWSEVFENDCEYLVLEDFETMGLTGDEAAGIHSDEENHFYHFFRTAGRTDKVSGTGKMGSWGIGKFVFLMSSRIRSMFGYTVRETNEGVRGRLLLGQAAAQHHKLDDKTYSNYGYFGLPTDPDLSPTMPYEDPANLSEFARDWGLYRTSETGLSVVVPYCFGIDENSLLLSVVNEFCGKILARHLEVDFDLPTLGSFKINRENIQSLIQEHSADPKWDDVKQLVSLLLAHEQIVNKDRIDLPVVAGGTAWSDLEISADVKTKLISTMQLSGMALVRVPVAITRINGEVLESYFDILVKQEELSDPIYPVFFRNGLRISGKQMGTANNGVRSIFFSGPGIIDELLTNAEGPAHTEWSSRDKFENKYKHDKNWLTFCRTAPKRVVEIARGATEENDFTSLSDLFPDPDYQPADATRPRNTRTQGTTATEDEVIVDQQGQIPVRLSKISGGFSLKLDDVQVDAIEVEMAYARNRGSHFDKWNKADFMAGALDIQVVHGALVSKAANRIVASVKDPKKFKLTVRGFDWRRELKVKANEAGEE
jgi:hypothetical protein